MYQGFEVWRKISQKIIVWGERRRDEFVEVVNNPKFTGKVEDMAKVLEAWDPSHRQFVALGRGALLEDYRLRIIKNISFTKLPPNNDKFVPGFGTHINIRLLIKKM